MFKATLEGKVTGVDYEKNEVGLPVKKAMLSAEEKNGNRNGATTNTYLISLPQSMSEVSNGDEFYIDGVTINRNVIISYNDLRFYRTPKRSRLLSFLVGKAERVLIAENKGKPFQRG